MATAMEMVTILIIINIIIITVEPPFVKPSDASGGSARGALGLVSPTRCLALQERLCDGAVLQARFYEPGVGEPGVGEPRVGKGYIMAMAMATW